LCILQRISPRRIRTSATDTSQFTMDRNRNCSQKWSLDQSHIWID
jgi:hypothetical protein